MFGRSIVLRRTRAGEWVFAKGHIEAGETAEQAARREAEEELGLCVSVLERLGQVRFRREDGPHRVEMFLLRADEPAPTWPAHDGVDAFCFPLAEVGDRLSFDNLRQFWQQALPRVGAFLESVSETGEGYGIARSNPP